MVQFAIKVDWLNMRVEFSPNLNITSAKTENDRTIFHIELKNPDSENEYPVFILSKETMDTDEVIDEDDRFWSGLSLVSSIPTEPLKANTSVPAESSDNEIERKKIEAQINSIQKMVKTLQESFQSGKIDQQTFLKKQELLGEKMGQLMAKLEQLK
ncbi:MAG: hypothetical protein ACTSU2_15740 [Promethearchaeota archaeon]